MDRKKYIACWLLLFALSPAVVSAVETAPGNGGGAVAERIRMSRVNYADQDRILAEARELFSKKEYKKALEKVEFVLGALDLQVTEVNSEIARSRLLMVRREARVMRHAWGQNLLMEARKLAADGKFSDAGNLAAQAVALANGAKDVPGMGGQPDSKLLDDASALLTECRHLERNAEMRREVSLTSAQSPNYPKDQKQIARLLREAEALMRAKRYDAALAKVEQVFIFDPLNADAMLLAGKLYQLFYRYGRSRGRTDTEANMAYTQWQWAEPVFMQSPTTVRDGVAHDGDAPRVYARLSRIVYPVINWNGRNLDSAIKELERDSKEFDPDHKGVVINFGASGDVEMPKLTLSLSHMPLIDIIRYICLMTGLEYRIDGNSILISRDAASTRVESKLRVSGKIFSDVLEMSGGAAASAGGGGGGDGVDGDDGGGGGGGGGAKGKGGASISNPTAEQWKNFFAEHMINIPDGSIISSDVRTGTLSIKTTSACLRDIEELLSQEEMQEEKMVMIEIRALEISEIDCQELGFNWNLNMLGYNMDSNGNMGTKGSRGWMFTQGSNTTNGSNNDDALSMVRGMAAVTGLANSSVVNNWNIFPSLFGSRNWFGSDTPMDIRLTINALAQNKRVETLSAPKLLTIDGKTASISVGKTYYFPESWDTVEISSESTENSSNYSYKITAPTPDIDKDGKTLGVYLEVRPKVQPDNQTIRLELKPRIQAYLGKDNGDGRYDVKIYARSGASGEFLYRSYSIWRARTSVRSLELVVDVHDGEPVVIGGIIDNSAVNRTDKIPILGDLPLIGRLFQSQAENLKRQNLIMFVTARQIDFRGNPVNKSSTGIPDFNR